MAGGGDSGGYASHFESEWRELQSGIQVYISVWTMKHFGSGRIGGRSSGEQ